MGLEHGLDLGGGDVLAPGDDRVRLAAGDVQPPLGVERAEVAGGEGAAAGDRRPGDEDLSVCGEVDAGAEERPRRSSCTCEQASVSP
jgi:hypothetical protein